MKKTYGIFLAGGSGNRMGGDIPKQFMLLDGIPILQRTIEIFASAVENLSVITVLPKDHIDLWKELCVKHAMDIPQTIVTGGITRFHSVQNALRRIPAGCPVMIHDGVRPLISPELVRSMLRDAAPGTGLVPSLPVTDTLKASDGISEDPDRSKIISVQTPQVFWSDDIKAAYSLPYETAFSDDSSVARKYGLPVRYLQGEKYNIKITTPEDLVIARALLKQKES